MPPSQPSPSLSSSPPPPPQTPSASPPQTPSAPPLPLELHTHILHHAPAAPAWPYLAWLWRDCRSASRLTRAAAEQVFVDRHLRRRRPRAAVQVLFPLGAHAVVIDTVADGPGTAASTTTVYELEVPMGFVGFEDEDEDGDGDEGNGGSGRGKGGGVGRGLMWGRRAVFRDERPAECFGEGVLEATMGAWREAVERWAVPGSDDGDDGGADQKRGREEEEEDGARKEDGGKGYVSLRPEAWRYWVQVRGLALDPELPDLRIDYERREISFDWRRMLDELFGEEAYARSFLAGMDTQDEVETSRELEDDAGGKPFCRDDGTHMPKEGIICDGDSDGCTLRRDAEEPETRAYLAARRQRIEKWYKKRHARGLRDGDWSTSEAAAAALPSEDADGPERVVEMLRLREDLAKDVSLCDNAKEIRVVYRWNTEHDSIRL